MLDSEIPLASLDDLALEEIELETPQRMHNNKRSVDVNRQRNRQHLSGIAELEYISTN